MDSVGAFRIDSSGAYRFGGLKKRVVEEQNIEREPQIEDDESDPGRIERLAFLKIQLDKWKEREREIVEEKLTAFLNEPIKFTKDFSNFPFPFVAHTWAEKRDLCFAKCLKFRTPHYVAYVHSDYQDYITPELLYSEEESWGMKEARRLVFGREAGIPRYRIQKEFPYEVSCVRLQLMEIESRHLKEHREEYGDLAEVFEKMEAKYTTKAFIYHEITRAASSIKDYCKENKGKAVLGVAGAVAAIAAVFFIDKSPSLNYISRDFINHF